MGKHVCPDGSVVDVVESYEELVAVVDRVLREGGGEDAAQR